MSLSFDFIKENCKTIGELKMRIAEQNNLNKQEVNTHGNTRHFK